MYPLTYFIGYMVASCKKGRLFDMSSLALAGWRQIVGLFNSCNLFSWHEVTLLDVKLMVVPYLLRFLRASG